ncbi:RIP metalloprotease RseP [Hydrogenobaculum acidophilum]
MIHTVLAFLILISILIVFHEFGHFIVAKLFGVKVEVFSVGFGTPIFKKKIGETEYQIAYIPMGGYVKLYGEEEDIHDKRAFSSKAPWQKILIAAAGPFFNLLIAFVAFTLSFYIGIHQPAYLDEPVKVGYIMKKSPFYKADLRPGDTIIKIDNTPIKTWKDLYVAEIRAIGKSSKVVFERDGHIYTTSIKLGKILNQDSIGILPNIPAVVGGTIKNSPAYQVGLKPKDKILAINGLPIKNWYNLSEYMKKDDGHPVTIVVERNNTLLVKYLVPKYSSKLKEYYIGVYPETKYILKRYPINEAMVQALKKIKDLTILSIDSIKALVTMHASFLNLSGPISIAKMSGKAAEGGLGEFLGFMAFVSLQLAIINILPIPMLDGGLIVLFLIEWIIRKPLSEKFKEYWQKVGIAFVVSLSAIAILSDIIRIFTGV